MISIGVGLLSVLLLITLFFSMFGMYLIGIRLLLIGFIIYILSIFRKYGFSKMLEISKTDLVIGVVLICSSVLNYCYFSDYKFEGGHDPGVYAEHAYWISQKKQIDLPNNFVNTLTFPGYKYANDKIVNTFPPLYPLYLSIFSYLLPFPISFKMAVMMSYLVVMLLIYSIAKLIINDNRYIIFLMFLISFNYYTIYIFRSTYVETFFPMFILSMTFSLLKAWKTDLRWLVVGFLSGIANCFTRSEALFNLVMYMLIAIYILSKKKSNQTKLIVGSLVPLFGFSIFLALFYVSNYYNYFGLITSGLSINKGVDNLSIVLPALSNKYLLYFKYFLNVLRPFGLDLILVLTLLLSLFNRGNKEHNINLFLLASVILPQFLYMIIPGIAPYLPWYFRRIYLYFFIYLLLIFVTLLEKKPLIPKKIINLIILVVFFLNIYNSVPILFKKDSGTLNKINLISEIDQQKIPIIFMDRFGVENIAPPLFFYKNIISTFDRGPFMDEVLYKCIFPEKTKYYLISSSINSINLTGYDNDIINGVTLKSQMTLSDTYLENACDIRSFLYNPKTLNSFKKIDDACRENNPPINYVVKSVNTFIYDGLISANNKTNTDCSIQNINKLLQNDLLSEEESYIN